MSQPEIARTSTVESPRRSVSSGSEGIDYTVRRSDRARRIRVHVTAAGAVEVVIPRRATLRQAQAAVGELAPWIAARLAEHATRQAQLAARGNELPYLDQTLTVVPVAGRTRADRHGDRLLVPAEQPEAAIERWYRRMARTEIERRLEPICRTLGVTHGKVSIRGQKTRWGSCSSSGALSFNWRLMLAPEAVLEYVIWHEACHLRVMNHSPRFWKLVAAHNPQYNANARWLRENGTLLVLR